MAAISKVSKPNVDCIFRLVLEKQEKFDGHQQFFAIVQLIGTRKQAENFAYRLELNGHRRRLTWEATPRSIHEGVSSAILNSGLATTTHFYVFFFFLVKCNFYLLGGQVIAGSSVTSVRSRFHFSLGAFD